MTIEPTYLKDLLLSLNEVRYSITPTQFYYLFGDVHKHLWSKYTGAFNYDLLAFFAYLDEGNKEKMCDYLISYWINEWAQEDANSRPKNYQS